MNQSLAMHLHRSFSHSLLAALALTLGFGIAAALMRHTYLRYLGWGLALGVVAHFTQDIFLWFTPVDIFWPASLYGVIPPVDLWFWWTPPSVLSRFLGAAEFGAFALYFTYLVRLADRLGTNAAMIQPVKRMAAACFASWAAFSALAFDLPDGLFTLALYIPIGLIFVPACFFVTWRMQATIEVLGAVE